MRCQRPPVTDHAVPRQRTLLTFKWPQRLGVGDPAAVNAYTDELSDRRRGVWILITGS